tara:strand:+ start:118 stop:687 length:570 start_codon:yes stop_codon:yes gene_type:complete
MSGPQKEEKEKKKVTEAKTFPVPFTLETNKESLSISTNSNTQTSEEEEIINKAIKFHAQGKISEATKFYKNFISQGFKDHRVFYNYGIILKNSRELEEAEMSIRKAIELDPDFPNAHLNLGIILSDLGKRDNALACLYKASELVKNNDLCLSIIGEVLLAQGNHAEGLSKLKAGAGAIHFDLKNGLSIS